MGKMTGRARDHTVTDDDIAKIIERHEAGIVDLMRAYGKVEEHYMAAAQAHTPVIVASDNTYRR